jgi:hypothetical protein
MVPKLKFLIPSKASAETSPYPAFNISSGNSILVVTDVSRQPIGPIFKGPEVQEEDRGSIGCPETLVNNYQSTPRNIPEERRSHHHTSVIYERE